ncbi:MAG: DUF2281 domain-containing protein [Burkholderiales bacterium]|nr:DUF2281 domain-containing protein [Anaerolineae bacterium]
MQRIALEDAAEQLSQLVDAAVKGETILIVAQDEREIQLVPLASATKKPRKAGSAAGLINMSDDFDAPLPDFNDYMA